MCIYVHGSGYQSENHSFIAFKTLGKKTHRARLSNLAQCMTVGVCCLRLRTKEFVPRSENVCHNPRPTPRGLRPSSLAPRLVS